MHLEYVVPGPPVSNQQSTSTGHTNLTAWKVRVRAEAQRRWGRPPLAGMLKVTIINFHSGEKPSLDLDNMSKPIHDAMNKLVYHDDRQIRQAIITHIPIDAPMAVARASKILVDAVQAGTQFVYIRVEDAEEPFPLPK
jgi:Holliday junction resolvase RusA-like endonuclease